MGRGEEFIREMGLAHLGQKFEKNKCIESLYLGFSAEYSVPVPLDQTDVVKRLSNDGRIRGYTPL